MGLILFQSRKGLPRNGDALPPVAGRQLISVHKPHLQTAVVRDPHNRWDVEISAALYGHESPPLVGRDGLNLE